MVYKPVQGLSLYANYIEGLSQGQTAPGTAVDADGVARQMARAQTFADAGNELI